MRESFWRWGEGMRRRVILFALLLTAMLGVLGLDIFAEEELPSGLSGIESEIPDDVRDRLPDGLFSEDGDEATEALTQLLSAKSVLTLVEELFRENALSAVVLFAKLCGVLLLASVFNVLCRSFASDTLSAAMRFCSSVAILATVINMQIGSL